MKQSKRKREAAVSAKAKPAEPETLPVESAADTAAPAIELAQVVEAESLQVADAPRSAPVAPMHSDLPSGAAHSNSSMLALAASCTVRDCIELKSALHDLFEQPAAITVDVRAVERIDTAILQLLAAFVRDRKTAGRTTQWVGRPECFAEAVRILGLGDALGVDGEESMGAAA